MRPEQNRKRLSYLWSKFLPPWHEDSCPLHSLLVQSCTSTWQGNCWLVIVPGTLKICQSHKFSVLSILQAGISPVDCTVEPKCEDCSCLCVFVLERVEGRCSNIFLPFLCYSGNIEEGKFFPPTMGWLSSWVIRKTSRAHSGKVSSTSGSHVFTVILFSVWLMYLSVVFWWLK